MNICALFVLYVFLWGCVPVFGWGQERSLADGKWYCESFSVGNEDLLYGDCAAEKPRQLAFVLTARNGLVRSVKAYAGLKKASEIHVFHYQKGKLAWRETGVFTRFVDDVFVEYAFLRVGKQQNLVKARSVQLNMPDQKSYRFVYHAKTERYSPSGELLSVAYYELRDLRNSQNKRLLMHVFYEDQAVVAYKVRRYTRNSIEEKYFSLDQQVFGFYNASYSPELLLVHRHGYLFAYVYYYDSAAQDAQLLLKEEYRFPKHIKIAQAFKSLRILNRSKYLQNKKLTKRQEHSKRFLIARGLYKFLSKKIFYFAAPGAQSLNSQNMHKIEFYHDDSLRKRILFSDSGTVKREEYFNLQGKRVFD